MNNMTIDNRNSNITDLIADYHSGDPTKKQRALDRIVDANMPLIINMIRQQYPTYGGYFEDLCQEGVIGLIDAIDKYDPEKSKPSTFFTFYIRHRLSDFCNTYVRNTSSHYSSRMKAVKTAMQELRAQGKEPDPVSISMITGLTLENVKKVMEIDLKSQVKMIGDDDFFDSLFHSMESPTDTVEDHERIQMISDAIADLPGQMSDVIACQFGLYDGMQMSVHETANKLDLSASAVRDLTKEGLQILRDDPRLRNAFSDRTGSIDTISIASDADMTLSDLAALDDSDLFVDDGPAA